MSNGDIDNATVQRHAGASVSHLFSRGCDGVLLTLAIIPIRSARVSLNSISALWRLI